MPTTLQGFSHRSYEIGFIVMQHRQMTFAKCMYYTEICIYFSALYSYYMTSLRYRGTITSYASAVSASCLTSNEADSAVVQLFVHYVEE